MSHPPVMQASCAGCGAVVAAPADLCPDCAGFMFTHQDRGVIAQGGAAAACAASRCGQGHVQAAAGSIR